MTKKIKWKLMDIHTHILPGVDDGAYDMDETMKMVGIADKEDISVIIATPHYGRRNPHYNPNEAIKSFSAVRDMMARYYPHIRIFLGNELYYSPGVIEDLKNGKARTIGGSDYVLVEFSYDIEYEKILSAVRAFSSEGYRPILAHIERYHSLYKNIDRIEYLIHNGAYMQVNARGFLLGRYNKTGMWCRKLLKQGLIHFIASDCHDSENRVPVMSSAIEIMIEVAGEEDVKRIVNTNIIKLIRNDYI